MGKARAARPVAENEAHARARALRVSPRKLNVLCGLIRGKNAESALAELSFTQRRIATDVRKVLQSAISNAESNHQLDVDRLYVSEASVGKSLTMKRMRPRARGRVGRIDKPFSRLTIVVREREENV